MKKLNQHICNLRRQRLGVWALWLLVLGAPVAFGLVDLWRSWHAEDAALWQPRSWSEIKRSDTLRVVTVGSSTTAFYDRTQWRGHEFEMASRVARVLGLQLQLSLAPDEHSMMDSLRQARADVAVYPLSYRSQAVYGGVQPCGYRYAVSQALVGRTLPAFSSASAPSADARPTLCVLAGSPQHHFLNDSISEWILPTDAVNVVVIADSAIQAETLVDWVAEGFYDLTIVESNRATLFHTYHRKLKVGPPLEGSADSVSWVVPAGSDTLAQLIDSLCADRHTAPQYPAVVKRYYEHVHDPAVGIHYLLGGGRLSVYDSLFHANARVIDWDWRLLAAVSFVESRFDPYVVSSVGARGLMQLMPSTAKAFGCPESLLSDPVANVEAGARLLAHLRQSLLARLTRSAVSGSGRGQKVDEATQQRIEREIDCFVLAGFHAGLGHIFDAITLADSLGYDPLTWHGNVEQCLILKSDSAYFNLPYVRLGRFSGRVTSEYVDEVLETYSEFRETAR